MLILKSMKTPPLKLKKVKIDEHIKSSNSGNSEAPKRKRGRPRKSAEPLAIPTISNSPPSPRHVDSESQQEDINHSIEPVYDTTEEAKGFLRAPFDIAAGLTGIPKLALYPAQLDALAPSFKIVYDKRIAPYLGEEADLITFAMVFSGILFEKVAVYKEEAAKLEKKEERKENLAPFIPMEHNV